MTALRRRWVIVALFWITAWLGFYFLLRPNWPASGRWLAQSGITLAFGLWVLWRNLGANHRSDEAELLPKLGPGNALTLARGLCIGLIAGFAFGRWPPGALAWVIVLFYTLADIADYFDGFLARRADHVTELGGVLDMEFDALGTLVVVTLAVSFGQLPWWYLGIGLARYLFIFGLWLRRRLGRAIHEMSPSVHRRVFAGMQMGFLSVVLWPILPRPMALLSGTLFAVATGLSFLRDWLVVSGVVDPASSAYHQAQQRLYRLFARTLPPVWRVLLVVAVVAILRAVAPLFPPATWHALLAGWGAPVPAALAGAAAVIALIGAPLAGLGILPRLLCVALVLPVGFDIAARGFMWDNGTALLAITFLLLFGPGPWALWPAEERFLLERQGAR